MRNIAFFLVLAYLLLFGCLFLPSTLFILSDSPPPVYQLFYEWSYWAALIVLLLCEAGLLFLPVKIESKRPLSRSSVLLPTLLSGFLAGALFFAMILSLYEFFAKERSIHSQSAGSWALLAAMFVWIVWMVIFAKISKHGDIKTTFLKQCNVLIQASFVSLLIAVPTHVIARHREYCCAGLYTFLGIAFGLSVMLLSFGPGIYFLYAQRWKKLHPEVLKNIERG